MFGITLTDNFNSPYLATSCREYWRRWHISLSRWILDYIFEPLQMRFRNWGAFGSAAAVVVTFLACGAWHGATWCYLIWGLLHGIYLAVSILYRPYQKKLHKWLRIDKQQWLTGWQVFLTFNLVSFAFIFFRARTVGDAVYVVTHILGDGGVSLATVARLGVELGIALQGRDGVDLSVDALIMSTMVIVCIINKYYPGRECIYRQATWCRWSIYYALVLGIIFFGVYRHSSFIYFKF